MKPTLINFKPLGDDRGSLIAIEAERSIPFPVRRVYYIFGTEADAERGFHAHKALNQVAVAVTGSCEIVLDDGKNKTTILLDSAVMGLSIEPGMWHFMKNFTSDCVLLVLADQHYDEEDYIRDYDAFRKWVGQHD